jgi:hypothetical protein
MGSNDVCDTGRLVRVESRDFSSQSAADGSRSVSDSACVLSPLHLKASASGSVSAAHTDNPSTRPQGNGLVDGAEDLISEEETSSDDENLEDDREADEESDLEDEDADDDGEKKRDRKLDREVLPKERPEWVIKIREILLQQEGINGGDIFGPLHPVDYLQNAPAETRPSLSSPDAMPCTSPPSSSSPGSIPSSPPSHLGHQNEVSLLGSTPSEPDESSSLPQETPTPLPRTRQQALPAVRRYELRTGQTQTSTRPVYATAQLRSTRMRRKAKGQGLLQHPPRRRDYPVCQHIGRSYLQHPEIPLEIVNPSQKYGKEFNPHRVNGNNIEAILDRVPPDNAHSIYRRMEEWRLDWTADIPPDLDDGKLLNGFDKKTGVVALHTSISKARVPMDVLQTLGKYVARAAKYPAWLNFLHMCALRVCTYWEPDPLKASPDAIMVMGALLTPSPGSQDAVGISELEQRQRGRLSMSDRDLRTLATKVGPSPGTSGGDLP